MTAACKKKHANQELGSPIDSEGENGEPEVLLKGDLAGILSLAAGRKTPARPKGRAGAAIVGCGGRI